MRFLTLGTVQLSVIIICATSGPDLMAGTHAVTPASPALVSDCPIPAPRVVRQEGDIRLVQITDEVGVEQLRGEAALAHLFNLKSKRTEAFALAQSSLQHKGFTPTDVVYVERTVRLGAAPWSNGTTTRPADYSEQNSDGEIVFWSWDDGDDSTWEGSIYIEVYSNGDASIWEGQIDASDTQHEWVWYQRTWERPGIGENGKPPMKHELLPPPRPGTVVGVRSTLASTDPSSLLNSYELADWMSWATCWRGCVVGGCTTAAAGCRFTGPGWAGCFGGWCVAVEIGCGVSCYL